MAANCAKVLGYWSPGPADVVALVLIGVGGYFIVRGLFGGRSRHQADSERLDLGDRDHGRLRAIEQLAELPGRRHDRGDGRLRDRPPAGRRCARPASIDVFVMWGGIEMRVPEDWTVELRGTPMLAGFVDKTRPPAVATEKRLVIRGVGADGRRRGQELTPCIRSSPASSALGAYLALWLVLGLAGATGLALRGGWPWLAAVAVRRAAGPRLRHGVPGGLVRLPRLPARRRRTIGRALLAHAGGGVRSRARCGWRLGSGGCARPGCLRAWSRDATLLLFAAGALLFLLSSAMHYVFLAVEAQDAARRQALESAVLAREAELRALRAQVNPHFLFNSLHSIGALAGTRPAAARDMAIALGEFLRHSLRLGGLAGVPLQQEIDLVRAVPVDRAGALRRPTAGAHRPSTPRPARAECRRCCCSRWSRTPSSMAWPACSRAGLLAIVGAP